MCPIHHDVIDDDPESFTVHRLSTMKSVHASRQTREPEPADSVANQFIAHIGSNIATNGSFIVTQNQMGGQVAHTIQNFGLQPRRLSEVSGRTIAAELQKYPPEAIELFCIMGDSESYQLAYQLKNVLIQGGWGIDGVNKGSFVGPINGILFETCIIHPGMEVLVTLLRGSGLATVANHFPDTAFMRLIIGANL